MTRVRFAFDSTYARLPSRFYASVRPSPVSQPRLIAFNQELAECLGMRPEEPVSPEDVEVLAGNRLPEGSTPIALAYAGHQFGHFVPQLGDGRAILLGEIVGCEGRRDVQLKGSGRTPFSRAGDGRAALGPVLREYLLSEAMAKLGVPTTRALAAIGTGDLVYREPPLPGAVLTRVARSHLRFGTFEYFAARGDREALDLLVRLALERHYPDAELGSGRALGLLESVMDAQARLVARWQALGFVHGVMNTDNMSIAGETIDYGPCAFLDAFEPNRTFSSIDQGGRYAFGNQPRVALWNLVRFAETLAPLLEGEGDAIAQQLTERLETFTGRFGAAYDAELAKKLGLVEPRPGDGELGRELLRVMAEDRVDYTVFFRRLCGWVEEDGMALIEMFEEPRKIRSWLSAWRARLDRGDLPRQQARELMRQHNPAFIPRNHRVEEMISAAMVGDFAPFERLLRVSMKPYEDQPSEAELAEPPGDEQWRYRTFCGT